MKAISAADRRGTAVILVLSQVPWCIGRGRDRLRSRMNARRIVAAALVLISIVVLGVTLARPRSGSAPTAAPVVTRPVTPTGAAAHIAQSPHLLFRQIGEDPSDSPAAVAALADPSSPRGVTTMTCDRLAFAAGRGVCLRSHAGLITKFDAVVFDAGFKQIATFPLDGRPSRARISPDGRIGAATVFVTGQEHGYGSVSFSTRTILFDTSSGTLYADLEQFKTTRDDEPFAAKDFNFWGVTFTRDSQAFYATLMTNRKTYLVRGDIASKTMTILRENVECPSLSPDNRLIAYKMRVGGDLAPW